MQNVNWKRIMVLVLFPLVITTTSCLNGNQSTVHGNGATPKAIGQESELQQWFDEWMSNIMEVQTRVLDCLGEKEEAFAILNSSLKSDKPRPRLINRNIEKIKGYLEANSLYIDGLIKGCVERDFPSMDAESKAYGATMARFLLSMTVDVYSACQDARRKDWASCVVIAQSRYERKMESCTRRNAENEDRLLFCARQLSKE